LNVLIIGASSGIGREVAHVLSQEGHNVICSSRDGKELAELTSDLKVRYDCHAYAVPVDLMQLTMIDSFINQVYQIFETLNCVIITAATMPNEEKPYYDQKELFDTVMTNYLGVAAVLNEISKRMISINSGIIICLSSPAGERGRQSNFIYGSTKSALNTYLQGLRMKLYKYNVPVITVLPGYVDTLMSYGKVKAVFAVSPRYVARRISKLTSSKRNVVYIPAIWWLVMKILKFIPESIYKRLTF